MQVISFAPEVVQPLSFGVPESEVLAEGDEGGVGEVDVGLIGLNRPPVLKL